ncbi:hypothetical protein K523DRAFT_142356 [Schizophyllum commune Tattone D]|nr:hypothetical protein K523DRAFT_142356 [Schizophyllum commune Tattone D]
MSKSIDCLGVYDILLQICVELQNQRSLRSLAAVAAVNRAISFTALDVLWESQGSWVPLLKTLEEHRLVAGSDRKELIIAGPIRRASWSRMQTSVAIPDATVRTLLIRSGGRRIIPDLREYQSFWQGSPSGLDAFPFLFIGSSLRDLRFHVDGSPHDAAIFATLPSLCPNLTKLNVSTRSWADIPLPIHDLSDTACQWKSESLRSVTLPIGSRTVVQHFGSMRALRLLHLKPGVTEKDGWPIVPHQPHHCLPMMAKSFRINSNYMRSAVCMLQSLLSSENSMEEVNITCGVQDATLAMRTEMVLLLFDIVNSDTIRSISCVRGV